MAADFALVALPGAYHSSVGVLIDSYAIACDRVTHVFTDNEPMQMETRLRIVSPGGQRVPLSDGKLLDVDGPIGGEEPLAFIWLAAFRAGGGEPLRQRLDSSGPLIAWLHRPLERGAIIGASGAAAFLLIEGGFTPDIAVPMARALQPVARELFPRQPLEDRFSLIDHGQMLIGSGMGSDLQLIIRVLERTLSPDIARWLTSIIGTEYEEKDLIAPDPLVARAQIWIEQRFTGQINMIELANYLMTSPATLNRRFHKAPGIPPKTYVGQ